MATAVEEEAILVTADKDFGELVYRQGRTHHGVLLIRLHGLAASDKARIVVGAVADHGEELPGAFAVIDRNRMRVRRTPS